MTAAVSSILFEGAHYAVRRVLSSAETRGPVVVAFPHAGGPTWNASVAFGEMFLKSRGIDGYFILNREVDWFQKREFFDAMAAIRADVPAARPIVAYGASMGGYGALLASRSLEAARVLSVVPQFSIDRSVVPWERRWAAQAGQIGGFIHDVEAEIYDGAEIYSLHDPRNVDAQQMALFSERPNWTQLRVPYCGHTPLVVLAQAGLLSGFVLAAINGDFDAQGWARRFLAARRETIAYWRILATHAARRNRFEIAQHAVERMKLIGAKPQEIEIAMQMVQRRQQSVIAQTERLATIAKEKEAARQARLQRAGGAR